MRSRLPLIAFVLLFSVVVLPTFAHASIPFFGPIIPYEWNRCPAGWGAIMIVVNNLIELGITLAIVFLAPLMIAYAGFLFLVNPVNASGKEKAKKVLSNTIIGIVIALAAWLIVDAVLVALTDRGGVHAWSDLIGSNGAATCLDVASALDLATIGGSGGVVGLNASGTPIYALPTRGDCTAASIQAAATASGQPLTAAQANTLSCIAMPESTCNANATNGNAVGMFQVIVGYNGPGGAHDQCHDLNFSSCTTAANSWAGSSEFTGNLNCSQAFSGSKVRAGQERLQQACYAAAHNFDCNASSAACLVKQNPSFSDWLADKSSDGQRQCINQFAH